MGYRSIKMIDPKTVLILVPTIDGRVESGFSGGLASCAGSGMFGGIEFMEGCSEISLARNLLVHKFLQSEFEWCVFIDSDIRFGAEDFRLLMDYPQSREDHNPDAPMYEVVCAEYSRKVDTLDPARFGLGFTRIHRTAFLKLKAADDDEGTPRVGEFIHQGNLISHFFPSGPGFDNIWYGEDGGFFFLCHLVGVTIRIEQRTKLVHMGRRAFPYVGVTGAN